MIRSMWKAAMKILKTIGAVQTALLLGLFYYLILAPFAILYQFSRIFRKTPSHPTSYWIKRPTEIPTREKLMQQF